ncbi:MAG: hypothetical protein V7695_13665 [Sulfitobacter sp.]
MSDLLRSPKFQLIYRGTDISGDMDPMTTSISYTDHVHGKANEISVAVHDKDGRWKGSWKPEHGDKMQLTIFDGAGGILPCGEFEMDEPDASGSRSGDTMTIRGMAAPITKALRTKKTRGFEFQSIRNIVEKVVSDLGLSLEGQIKDHTFARVTQRRERDLEFLKRFAEETGHYFSVRGLRATFTSLTSIDGQGPAFDIFHGDRSLIDYKFKLKSKGTFSKAKATYLSQNSGKTVAYEEVDPTVSTGDTLRISGERLENAAHAEMRAKSALHFANRKKFTGSVKLVGNTRAIAGNTANLTGFGGYSGKRLINSSNHTLSRGGYVSSAELLHAITE